MPQRELNKSGTLTPAQRTSLLAILTQLWPTLGTLQSVGFSRNLDNTVAYTLVGRETFPDLASIPEQEFPVVITSKV